MDKIEEQILDLRDTAYDTGFTAGAMENRSEITDLDRQYQQRQIEQRNRICWELIDQVNNLQNDFENATDALSDIADIAYGRDGFTSAEDLGELVDELREIAIGWRAHEVQEISDDE